MPIPSKYYYRRALPHFTPDRATYFVTIRLADSLPVSALQRLKGDYQDLKERQTTEPNMDPRVLDRLRKRYLVELDKALDQCLSGPDWLSRPTIQSVVKRHILELERNGYIAVVCYSIMPNHVHLVFSLLKGKLSEVMQLLKGRTAIECNQVLARRGKFWQHESYDHVVRAGELERIISYVLMNPVKAQLCTDPMGWPGNYLASSL